MHVNMELCSVQGWKTEKQLARGVELLAGCFSAVFRVFVCVVRWVPELFRVQIVGFDLGFNCWV